jgi:hypothetical protein
VDAIDGRGTDQAIPVLGAVPDWLLEREYRWRTGGSAEHRSDLGIQTKQQIYRPKDAPEYIPAKIAILVTIAMHAGKPGEPVCILG